MPVRLVVLVSILVLGLALPSVAATTGPKGNYKGTAKTGKRTTKVGASIEKKSCPDGKGKYKQSLCLVWSPGFITDIKCMVWNDADPTHKPSKESRSILYNIGGVSATGSIDYSETKTGPGYTETLRVTASAKSGKLTGKVSYVTKGRSSIISKDCSGSTTFSLKKS